MKINVEVDVTPEELRRFMGLPDVQGIQQQMIESFTGNLKDSADQQQEFFRALITGSFAPWQSFFAGMNPAPTTSGSGKK